MPDIIWKQSSSADVPLDHVYLTDERVEHIRAAHSDLADDPEKVRTAISDTTRVLRPKAEHGSGAAYKRYIFVNDNVRTQSGRSFLMAVVERETTGAGKVITATWKNRIPGATFWQAESNVTSQYDTDADIAYLSRGNPRQNYSEDDDEDSTVWLRRADDDDQPIGVTVLEFRWHWEHNRDQLVGKIAAFLSIPADEIRQRLAGIIPA